MALRITQGMMYSSYVGNMNTNLSALMESNLQASSQKRVNRPSDDAVGTSRILAFRANLERLDTYSDNIKTAYGWVSTADKILSDSATTVLSKLITLAEQGATGTYTEENRKQMAFEIKGYFEQMINIANTTYNGQHIFAGHKTNQPAFREGLAVTANDPAFAGQKMNVEGGSKSTILVQATSSGLSENATYRYSDDGGNTWHEATVDTTLGVPYTAQQMRINAGGASIICDKGTPVKAVNPEDRNEKDNGTWLYIRPTAVYLGDDDRTQVVTPYGSTIGASAQGYFTRDVAIKVDSIEAGTIRYSYSTDDGATWKSAVTADLGADTRLPVPGGYLNLDATPNEGEQYIIHPRRASVELSITETDSIALNMIGKDIFGGLYQDPDPSVSPGYPTVVEGKANLFEAVGRLVGYAETNSQQGMQQALEELKLALEKITTAAAEAGGKSNRLAVTDAANKIREYTETDGLSAVEDIDVTELMTKLAQQQLAYNSVLKSSSMIMQMSLLNFL